MRQKKNQQKDKPWQLALQKGLLKLSRHDPKGALKFFQQSLESCSVRQRKGLARILYFTGITLYRLGLHDSAVKSWVAAKKLCKSRLYRTYVQRFSNAYGMAKQAHPELDDWRAFYAIQIKKYLKTKKSHAFGTRAEQDMIRDLIFDSWQSLLRSGVLAEKSIKEKLKIYHQHEIIFPYFLVPETSSLGQIVKEREGMRFCPCGSGLPFHLCCGRSTGSARWVIGKL